MQNDKNDDGAPKRPNIYQTELEDLDTPSNRSSQGNANKDIRKKIRKIAPAAVKKDFTFKATDLMLGRVSIVSENEIKR